MKERAKMKYAINGRIVTRAEAKAHVEHWNGNLEELETIAKIAFTRDNEVNFFGLNISPI